MKFVIALNNSYVKRPEKRNAMSRFEKYELENKLFAKDRSFNMLNRPSYETIITIYSGTLQLIYMYIIIWQFT